MTYSIHDGYVPVQNANRAMTYYHSNPAIQTSVSKSLFYPASLPPTGNVVPANYFASVGAPLEMANGNAIPTRNIPLREATPRRVGSSYSNLFQKYAPTTLRIYDDQGRFAGSATLLSPTLVLTASHLFSRGRAYRAFTSTGQALNLNPQLTHGYPRSEYTLVRLQAPVRSAVNFPVLDYADCEQGTYGMLHFANGGNQLLVTVGEGSGISYAVSSPTLAIDGGKGASGALLWKPNETAVSVHMGVDHAFSLRSSLFIHEIISDELARYGESWILQHTLCTERLRALSIPHESRFTCSGLDPEAPKVKKRKLESDLLAMGWFFSRNGGDHDIWKNGHGDHVAVPRHIEIVFGTARSIIEDAKQFDAARIPVTVPTIPTMEKHELMAELVKLDWFFFKLEGEKELWHNLSMTKRILVPKEDQILLDKARAIIEFASQNVE